MSLSFSNTFLSSLRYAQVQNSGLVLGVGTPQDAAAHIRSGHKGRLGSQHCTGDRGDQSEKLSGGRAGGDIRGQIEGSCQEGGGGSGWAVPQSLGPSRALHDPRLHGWHWTLAHFGTVE